MTFPTIHHPLLQYLFRGPHDVLCPCLPPSRPRTGNAKEVFSCYTQLAQHYQARRDNHTGVYFLEKCLEIARLTKDAVSEMLANHNLGLAHEQVRAVGCG